MNFVLASIRVLLSYFCSRFSAELTPKNSKLPAFKKLSRCLQLQRKQFNIWNYFRDAFWWRKPGRWYFLRSIFFCWSKSTLCVYSEKMPEKTTVLGHEFLSLSLSLSRERAHARAPIPPPSISFIDMRIFRLLVLLQILFENWNTFFVFVFVDCERKISSRIDRELSSGNRYTEQWN